MQSVSHSFYVQNRSFLIKAYFNECWHQNITAKSLELWYLVSSSPHCRQNYFCSVNIKIQAISSALFSIPFMTCLFSKSICLNLLWQLGLQPYSFRIPSTAAVGIDWQVIICEEPGTSILLRTKPDTAGPGLVAENCSKVQFLGWGEML